MLPACGGDDSDEAMTQDASAAYCDGLISVSTSEPNIPADADEAAVEAAYEHFFTEELLPTPQVKDEFARMVEILETEGPASFDHPEFNRLNATVQGAAIEDCDVTAVEVTGVDYAYEGAPELLAEGVIGFRFHNGGTEVHEMVLLRKNDDVSESFAELTALPRDESYQKVQGFGRWSAEPNQSDARIARLTPGDYAMICTIPVGTTALSQLESAEGTGEPHFARGMLHEFTVE
jgi:hypothetical protein